MRKLALLKLKDNLTVYEAGDYLAEGAGVDSELPFAHVVDLVNEGKLNLYLYPAGLRKKLFIDYDSELEGNECELRGEQKFISVFLNTCAYTLHVEAGAEIEGDVFVGKNISWFLATDGMTKAEALENTVLTNRISTITDVIYQPYENSTGFFYIKREEIDALIAQIQDTHEPEKNEHLIKPNAVNQHAIIELNEKIKALEDEKEELKAQLNVQPSPRNSSLLVIARAYELYSKGKESTHTQAAFNAELRDGNDLHGMRVRTIDGLLSTAAKALDQERKRKQ